MTNKNKENIEAIKKISARMSLYSPSDDFAAKIMERVLLEPQPELSKRSIYLKYGLLTLITGIIVVLYFYSSFVIFDFNLKTFVSTISDLSRQFYYTSLIYVSNIIKSPEKILTITKLMNYIPMLIVLGILAILDQKGELNKVSAKLSK